MLEDNWDKGSEPVRDGESGVEGGGVYVPERHREDSWEGDRSINNGLNWVAGWEGEDKLWDKVHRGSRDERNSQVSVVGNSSLR